MADLRDAVFSAKDYETELYAIERWGGISVELRSMSARMRARLIEVAYRNKDKNQEDAGVELSPLFPDIVLDGVYDPITGARVFQIADREKLLDKNGDVLQDLALKIITLSKIGGDSLDDAGKNSSGIPNAELIMS